jgi:hypothetical protein
MKKPSKKVLTLMLCGALAVSVTAGTALLFGEKEAESLTVSAGLQQFADEAYLASAAPLGQSIAFTPEWFDTAMNGGAVSAITVTALPPATEGTLMLGQSTVSKGQIIPRETLSFLSFVPSDGVRESSFSFMPAGLDGSTGYTLSCRLSLTDSTNCCPTGTRTVTAVSTHSSIALTGTLCAEDPEGDAVRYEVVSYPAGGTLLLDNVSGVFTYTPDADFTGEDTFVWRAQDIHGAMSEAVSVKIAVRELATGYLFSDIADGNVQSAALRVSEKGLLSGEVMGGKHYFHPDRQLTRAAFVAILLNAAEVKAPDAEDTGFSDDADIPRGMKGAIRYAREQGWLGEDSAFRPNDPITRAEAATIAAKVLSLDAPGYAETVTDFAAIPVDVADALYAIYEGGYLFTMADGSLAPAGILTRGDAARFFSRILDGKS